jgi:hypothetical protein
VLKIHKFFINLLTFLCPLKNKIILYFVNLWGQKGRTKFPHLFFVLAGSGIRDGRKSGSGINIPHPQHFRPAFYSKNLYFLFFADDKLCSK